MPTPVSCLGPKHAALLSGRETTLIYHHTLANAFRASFPYSLYYDNIRYRRHAVGTPQIILTFLVF